MSGRWLFRGARVRRVRWAPARRPNLTSAVRRPVAPVIRWSSPHRGGVQSPGPCRPSKRPGPPRMGRSRRWTTSPPGSGSHHDRQGGLVRWSSHGRPVARRCPWFPAGSTRAYTDFCCSRMSPGTSACAACAAARDHTRDQVLAEMAVVKSSGWDDRVLFQSFQESALRAVHGAGSPGRSAGPDPARRPGGLRRPRCGSAHSPRQRPGGVGQDELHAAGIAVTSMTSMRKSQSCGWSTVHVTTAIPAACSSSTNSGRWRSNEWAGL